MRLFRLFILIEPAGRGVGEGVRIFHFLSPIPAAEFFLQYRDQLFALKVSGDRDHRIIGVIMRLSVINHLLPCIA